MMITGVHLPSAAALRRLRPCAAFRFGVSGALLAALLFAAPAVARCQKTVISAMIKNYPRAPLTLYTPSNARFDEMVAVSFPGLQDANFQAIRPYTVLVTNGQPVQARAYAIRWTFSGPNGSQTAATYSWFATRLTAGPGRSKAVGPGDVRLVSPVFNFSAADWAASSSLRADFGAEYRRLLANFQPPGTGVTAALQGVVYLDGTVGGPAPSRVLERYLCRVNGEHDEIVKVWDSLQLGALVPQIESELTADVRRGRADMGKFLPARYVRSRGRSAQRLRVILVHRGFMYFQSTVNFLANNTRPNGRMSFMAAWDSPDYRYHHPAEAK